MGKLLNEQWQTIGTKATRAADEFNALNAGDIRIAFWVPERAQRNKKAFFRNGVMNFDQCQNRLKTSINLYKEISYRFYDYWVYIWAFINAESWNRIEKKSSIQPLNTHRKCYISSYGACTKSSVKFKESPLPLLTTSP